MAAWVSRATTTANTITAVVPVDRSGKKANDHAAAATAPAAYTGRRPNRSDSAPNEGIRTSWNAEPTSTAVSPTLRSRPTVPVMNTRLYTVKV